MKGCSFRSQNTWGREGSALTGTGASKGGAWGKGTWGWQFEDRSRGGDAAGGEIYEKSGASMCTLQGKTSGIPFVPWRKREKERKTEERQRAPREEEMGMREMFKEKDDGRHIMLKRKSHQKSQLLRYKRKV